MAYIGNSPENIQRGRRSVYEFKATAGQTAFSGTDLNNQALDLLEENEMGVYLNGIRLADSDDYSISGDTLTLLSAASLNDQLTVETQAEVANISSYTRTETDARYINYDGDIINGTLQIAGSGNNIELGDNNKAVFGGGSDLEIYHSGTQSIISDVGSGNLNLEGDSKIVLRSTGGSENYAQFFKDGAVELYYNNAVKIATTATGIDVTGNATFADNGKAIFGAVADLQIYSDGSHSYLQEGSGTSGIRITSDNQVAIRKHDNENIAVFNIDGAVRFYHDNAQKFSTTSTGIDVTGTVTSDGLTSAGNVLVSQSGANSSIIINRTDEAPQYNLTMGQSGTSPYITGNDAEIFHINVDPDNTQGNSGFNVNVDGKTTLKASSGGDISFYEDTGTTAKFFWDASTERLGLGTSSPDMDLHVTGGEVLFESTGNSKLQIKAGNTSGSFIEFADAQDANIGRLFYDHSNNHMQFTVNASEAMRIDHLGNLLVGKTSSALSGAGISLLGTGRGRFTFDNYEVLELNRLTSDGDIVKFFKDGTSVGSIGTASNFMTIGSGDVGLRFHATNNVIFPHDMSANNTPNGTIALGTTGSRFSSLWLASTGNAAFFTASANGSAGVDTRIIAANTGNGGNNRGVAISLNPAGSGNSVEAVKLIGYQNTAASTANNAAFAIQVANTSGTQIERVRIDASGNFLVGQTAANATNVGFSVRNQSTIVNTVSGADALELRRHSSAGSIINFRYGNSTIGSIGVVPNNITIGSGDTGFAFLAANDAIVPWNIGSPNYRDNAISLGVPSVRFDNIYATNGTIQTSDFNEKQDIASLTATEMLVGKRISALFKTFRWKDSVAEKGENARTHTGVIAQDVQAAFTAEGLDAGDYALFISSTWFVDAEGNEVEEGTEGATSKTRLGIRYPELLSFVAAYNEQRFDSIEARLTALEES